jgi:hypothetical protein
MDIYAFAFGSPYTLCCTVSRYCLVAGVKPSLHTPLMSMSNAISGIVILGGMLQIQGEYLDKEDGNPTQVCHASPSSNLHWILLRRSPTLVVYCVCPW